MTARTANMVILAAVILLALVASAAILGAAPGRNYHRVTVAQLVSSPWTHVQVEGLVTYVRKQFDGDVHVTIENAGAIAVVEIIPAIPLPAPRKGQRIRVFGISRADRDHGWPEVHPAERIEVLR